MSAPIILSSEEADKIIDFGPEFAKTLEAEKLTRSMFGEIDFFALILTYEDEAAHNLLDLLRTRFWANDQVFETQKAMLKAKAKETR